MYTNSHLHVNSPGGGTYTCTHVYTQTVSYLKMDASNREQSCDNSNPKLINKQTNNIFHFLNLASYFLYVDVAWEKI